MTLLRGTLLLIVAVGGARDRPISQLSGNTQDLKKDQIRRLKKLAGRRIRENVLVSQEFARALCALSVELGRQLGALIDRQGHVRVLIVGDAQRIFIPDLERRGAVRLRGLRLVHTHLYQEPLSQEDLADLTLLRLDYITAITIDDHGLPASYYSAHVQPGNPGYELEPPRRPGTLTEDFTETMDALERSFREETKLKHAGPNQRAILVGVYTPAMRAARSPTDSMAELWELATTAGVEPVVEFKQTRSRLDAGTVIGSGKATEIGIRAVQEGAELLIFDLELTPAQATKLSALCDLKIIDRTQLILDIFARNARSRDGKLQVELAQLRYLKGRLSEKDDNMSRLTGGIGGRGPGETKLEIGRRRVNDRIMRLEKELKSLKHRRQLNRAQRDRSRVPVVSIVGYTNAGKSTLLNALTNSEVYTEQRLFATLDPTTRRLRFPHEREIILSDTVGFIHDLPPELGRAFEATLEELGDSDLLLHCVDVADPRRQQKMIAVEKILADMDLGHVPVQLVLNKSDMLGAEERQDLPIDDALLVSASTREGLAELTELVRSRVFRGSVPEVVGT